MITILDISDWFLNKEKMTHKKLQKLCYYAQAWHLALFDCPLFDSSFQAWIHGPVCPILYSKYKTNGWNTIPQPPQPAINDIAILTFLERIWITYGALDGHELEILTHQESPWIDTRNGIGPWDPSTEVITHEEMKNYYSQKYQGD